MTEPLQITPHLLAQIHDHVEAAYPEEGAGFLLGQTAPQRRVTAILPLPNVREAEARHNRYLIRPEDYLQAELEAESRGLTLLGVFHSHPDHPNRPSPYDRDWAQPFFSYIITSVWHGQALDSRCWLLREDRSVFDEQTLLIEE